MAKKKSFKTVKKNKQGAILGLNDNEFGLAFQINQIVNASHPDPFSFLGIHKIGNDKSVIRIFQPYAENLRVILDNGEEHEGDKVHNCGFFEVEISFGEIKSYKISYIEFGGHKRLIYDPYSFDKVLSDDDIYYIREGTHKLFDKFGANFINLGGVDGVSFVVWAPNALRVSLVGDFNRWDGRINSMRKRLEVGVWEIFIPKLDIGMHYKFEVVGADGDMRLKSDPFAFYAQSRQLTASILWKKENYKWNDKNWIDNREKTLLYQKPVSIYEVHLGSWRKKVEDSNRSFSYLELADELVEYVHNMGFTHVEFMPTTEYPYDGSWGYQVTGFFAPTSRYGNPDEFKYLVDKFHQRGIGIILDWVPAHFPKDEHGLSTFDGTALYEHEDVRKGLHKDWDTLIFNYGREEVASFLIASALFWLEEYHIDGLRVDAVASMLYLDYSRDEDEWLPNHYGGRENLEAISFVKRLNESCYMQFPGVMMIAEESTAWQGVSHPTYKGGLGFGFKWNMGWMNDMLEYISKEPVHRKYHHGEATFSMIYAYDENFILVLSHDEVVHSKGSLLNKMPGDYWQKFANCRMFLAWMYAHPGKKLLFQGIEIGQWDEWNFSESTDWHLLEFEKHKGLQTLVKELNNLYRREPALHNADHKPGSFEWLRVDDSENSIFAFSRYALYGQEKKITHGEEDPELIVVINATPVNRHGYRLDVRYKGIYKEIFNSDSSKFGGSGVINTDEIQSFKGEYDKDFIEITLPPLSCVFLQRV